MDRISELTRTLAAVRPVGMDDNMASDWQVAVLADTMHLSDDAFRAACRKARAECTHHGQILKTMLQPSKELAEFRRQMDAYSAPFLRDHGQRTKALPQNDTQRAIADASRSLRRGAP